MRSRNASGSANDSSSSTISTLVIGATPLHRFALHRRKRGSSAPLLFIASLCMVVSAGHRLSSSSRCDRLGRASRARGWSG
ncbi:hypothetical protein CKW46_06510 [Mycobacterium liflandii]|nr:hypothetical protein CKW46_06510 [Mycobacterium liflandii]